MHTHHVALMDLKLYAIMNPCKLINLKSTGNISYSHAHKNIYYNLISFSTVDVNWLICFRYINTIANQMCLHMDNNFKQKGTLT